MKYCCIQDWEQIWCQHVFQFINGVCAFSFFFSSHVITEFPFFFTLSFPGAIGQLLDSLEEIQVLTGAKTDDVNFLQSLFENHTLQALLEVMILSVLKELLWPITAAGSWINWTNHDAPKWHMPPALSKNSWANISNQSLFVFAYYSPKLFDHEMCRNFLSF